VREATEPLGGDQGRFDLDGAPLWLTPRASLALALAFAGRRDEAIRQGEQAIKLEPIATNAITGPIVMHYVMRAHLALGDGEAAMRRLETLLKVPYFVSPAWVEIDPSMAPLREHPRFKALRGRSSANDS
jgi:hypothetical protein